MTVSKKTANTVKPGGEGGTPGIITPEIETVTETESFESIDVEAAATTKPGGEGGTPGV